MADLVATLASTHHPFYLKATTMPPGQQLPEAPEWKRKAEASRETLARAQPDILVMVGSVPLHQSFLDNCPPFLIVTPPRSDPTAYNEDLLQKFWGALNVKASNSLDSSLLYQAEKPLKLTTQFTQNAHFTLDSLIS